jgi:hypothetical protein
MSRRALPREAMSRRAPLLLLSLVLLLGAFVLLGTGKAVAGFTVLIGAFLAVAAAKRS